LTSCVTVDFSKKALYIGVSCHLPSVLLTSLSPLYFFIGLHIMSSCIFICRHITSASCTWILCRLCWSYEIATKIHEFQYGDDAVLCNMTDTRNRVLCFVKLQINGVRFKIQLHQGIYLMHQNLSPEIRLETW